MGFDLLQKNQHLGELQTCIPVQSGRLVRHASHCNVPSSVSSCSHKHPADLEIALQIPKSVVPEGAQHDLETVEPVPGPTGSMSRE
eukprot:845681-Rhodomonas_salina.1